MLVRNLTFVATFVLLLSASVVSLAQESPEDAKRRAAMEAERKAEAEKRKAIEDELRRKEAQGGTDESLWDTLEATITGQVSDAGAQPVAGAMISGSWDQGGCENKAEVSHQTQEVGQSFEDGSFRFIFTVKLLKTVTSLDVSFHATHDDHLPSEAIAFTLVRNGQVKDAQLSLQAAGSISGQVTDSNGRALAGATVCATSHERSNERKAGQIIRQARTDEAGNYTIKGLPTDTYTVTTECPGYQSVGKLDSAAVKAGEASRRLDLVLRIATAVIGTIEVRAWSADRIGNCSFYEGDVCVQTCSLVVRPDLTFVVIDPPVGTWEVEISWWNYQSTTRTAVTVNEGQHVDVGSIKVEAERRELPND